MRAPSGKLARIDRATHEYVQALIDEEMQKPLARTRRAYIYTMCVHAPYTICIYIYYGSTSSAISDSGVHDATTTVCVYI